MANEYPAYGGILTIDEDPTFTGPRRFARSMMDFAKRDIDELFGTGYAEAHPEIVGNYMLTAARHYSLTPTGLGDDIADGLRAVAEAIRETHYPLDDSVDCG